MEQIISKQEVDHLFSLINPEWQAKLVAAYDPSTGIGRFIQPVYSNEGEPPICVIVGFYYPLGNLPPMTDKLQKDIETLVETELGNGYSVLLRYCKTEDCELIELTIESRTAASTQIDLTP